MDTACDWPIDDCGDCLTGLDPDHQQRVIDWATAWLFQATGSKYGLCPVTVRPCRLDCRGQHHAYPVGLGLRCGRCRRDLCGCGAFSEALLPGPVAEILEVEVDGEVLPSGSAYRVDNYSSLVRLDGEAWPTCQDWDAQPGQVGTWTVTYRPGWPVPAGAGSVVALLACELSKACQGDSGCRLPKRVQTVTRQGVTMGFVDNFEQLTAGMTGIFEIDGWITTANLTGRQRVGITSPDLPTVRRQTWP